MHRTGANLGQVKKRRRISSLVFAPIAVLGVRIAPLASALTLLRSLRPDGARSVVGPDYPFPNPIRGSSPSSAG
jgi:hypothetical protein